MKPWIIILVVVAVGLVAWGASSLLGAGALERKFTISGVYAVCKPDGYPAICFLDADSNQGGLSCMSYAGECR